MNDALKCPTCGKPNCIGCRVRELLERLAAVRAEMPQLSEAEKERQRRAAPAIALEVSMHALVVDLCIRGLRPLSTGRYALCDEHALPAEATAEPHVHEDELAELARDVHAAGFAPDNVLRVLARSRAASPAVLRHTLERFARLWQDIRAGGVLELVADMEPVQDIRADGVLELVADMEPVIEELDELARGVLS